MVGGVLDIQEDVLSSVNAFSLYFLKRQKLTNYASRKGDLSWTTCVRALHYILIEQEK